MYDLAALGIAAVCLAFCFVVALRAREDLMSAGDVFGLVVSLLVLRLPRLRALPRGAVLDERAGNRPDRLLRDRADRARLSARASSWRACTRASGSTRSSAASSACSAAAAARSRTGRLREDGARLQRPLHGRALRDPAAAGPPLPQPGPLKGVAPHIALNTTASFVTNTNWQFYGGEYTMSYLTQMAGLAVQNFVSAAVGMAVLVAVVRGIARRSTRQARQLLGRPLPVARLHPAAALDHPRGAADLAGRAADVPRARDGDDAAGRAPDDRARPGRVADRDQAARDERRRLLQLELGRPVREPERRARTSSRCSRSC